MSVDLAVARHVRHGSYVACTVASGLELAGLMGGPDLRQAPKCGAGSSMFTESRGLRDYEAQHETVMCSVHEVTVVSLPQLPAPFQIHFP